MITPLIKPQFPVVIDDDGIEYPVDNGELMAETSEHLDFIFRLFAYFFIRYESEPLFSVHCNMLWYPLRGINNISAAPDIMLIDGRPQIERSVYRNWHENGISPQVVFEIWSKGNSEEERRTKLEFYENYGVEVFIAIDLLEGEIEIYTRKDLKSKKLSKVEDWENWVCPRTGIRFALRNKNLREVDDQDELVYQTRKRIVVLQPDGKEIPTISGYRKEVERKIQEMMDLAQKAKEIERAKNEMEEAKNTAEHALLVSEERAEKQIIQAKKEKIALQEQAEKEKIALQEQAEKEKIALQEQAEKEKIALQEQAEKEKIALLQQIQELRGQIKDLKNPPR